VNPSDVQTKMSPEQVSRGRPCDLLVVGGGPGGATAALVAARAGLAVRVFERARMPRFRIGESFMPRNLELLRELGLEDELRRLPHVEKCGVEFAFGDGEQRRDYPFAGGLLGTGREAFNVERAPFDRMLLAAAARAGAEVLEGRAVRRIVRLSEGGGQAVAVEADGGETFTARVLIDASGQATLVAKHLGTRKVLPGMRKVSYFAHFEDVARRPGAEGGFPTMVMCDEGWFWLIPMDETRTSVGLVMDAEVARRVGMPPQRMLAWGIARCPAVRHRMARARGPEQNLVMADFSYRCSPYAGPGYFLVGDAATFVDPIFSTGSCLAMMGGAEAARAAVALLRAGARPARVRRRYVRFVERTSAPFFRLVEQYYQHSFRELFLNGEGPCQVHRAVLSVLAGSVFPRPVFALRWRSALMTLFVRLNRHLPLVPRRRHFSLLAAEGGEGAGESEPAGEDGAERGAGGVGEASGTAAGHPDVLEGK
jgi:flavin-dependent dehydrogenase